MIQHYSKVALRNLMKYKTQNLISTIGLAVGLLCFSICFYCSRYMQSVDQCFNNYHRLVDINLADEGRMLSGTPAILAEKLTKEYGHEVEAYSRLVERISYFQIFIFIKYIISFHPTTEVAITVFTSL